MFTPKGLSVRVRKVLISCRTASRSPDEVSITPRPPASHTAEASCDRAIQPIGAWMIGYCTPKRSVMRLRMAMVSSPKLFFVEVSFFVETQLKRPSDRMRSHRGRVHGISRVGTRAARLIRRSGLVLKGA